MIILGVNGGEKPEAQVDESGAFHHDAAAALILNGRLIAAVEEERLNRIKHTNCFPARAIKYCLAEANLRPEQIDRIAVNSEAWNVTAEAVFECLNDPSRAIQNDASGVIGRLFESEFGLDLRDRIRFCQHHFAHAWSAYAMSGFSESLVMSVDAWGDDCCGMVFHAQHGRMKPLRRYNHSLGLLYVNMIRVLGLRRFDEYKAMGLAPYGDKNTLSRLFDKVYQLLPRGGYEISQMECEAMLLGKDLGLRFRRTGQPFQQFHMDFAAGLQNVIEEIVLHILRHYAAETGLKNLCLAGGVAQNCTLNGKILESELFQSVFVPPASHDAGGAIGAAYAIAFEEDATVRCVPTLHSFFGAQVGNDAQIARNLRRWSDVVSFERLDNVCDEAARVLAEGKVIGWVQDRSEFGPRALGNRSILADPRPAGNKDRINALIKKRESFRPFAPAVVAEKVTDFFDVPSTKASLSFMTYVLPVKMGMRDHLGAVTHVDGTARVQAVERSVNHKFWKVITCFGNITGTPIVLNTSFNNDAEPIVDSLDDAITCFLTTALDYLFAGDFLVQRKGALGESLGIENLSLSVPPYCRLEKKSRCRSRTGEQLGLFAVSHVKENCNLSSERDGYKGPRTIEVSPEMFSMLLTCNSSQSIGQVLDSVCVGNPGLRTRMIHELLELWSRRLVKIAPLSIGDA
jgi:carbamoyltransferase